MQPSVFLASSISDTGRDIPRWLKRPATETKLGFITTASEVEEGDKTWLSEDRQALVDAGFEVQNYSVTGKTKDEVETDLANFDVICMDGGNTFYLLQQLQKADCMDVIRDFVAAGKTYIGSSAGSLVAGPDIEPAWRPDEMENAKEVQGSKGLGLVDVVTLPHWGADHFREVYLSHRMKHAYNTKQKIILLRDNQYLRVTADGYSIEEI